MGKTYFISDLHLGAGYISDGRAHQQRVVRFLESIAADADELIMLGDVLDYWYEYRTVVPRGFTRFFGALARLADRGVKITWFIGNHDIWRSIFRNRLCQKLYAAIHPRWTIPFAHAWSTHSRNYEAYEAAEGVDSSDPLVDFCREYLRDVDSTVDYFVFGHRHVLADFPLNPQGCRMVILGDWIRHFSYGVFDGQSFALRIFSD